ncbi:MAG: glycerophosphodiester phosphodiesterase family protein, partial [Bacteroidota bacterium]
MKIFLVLSILINSLLISAQSTLTPLPKTKNGFVVISHRGNHVQVPENTVASIEEAIKAGADYAEIDLRTTKDGYLVICHDGTVDRTTNGKGKVKDLTLDEIKNLKITSKDKSDTKLYRVPEFSEILKACKKEINIYLDFKDASVEEAYRQIKDAGMEKYVVVYLNKESQYPEWRKTAPDMPLMTSVPETVKTKGQLELFLS